MKHFQSKLERKAKNKLKSNQLKEEAVTSFCMNIPKMLRYVISESPKSDLTLIMIDEELTIREARKKSIFVTSVFLKLFSKILDEEYKNKGYEGLGLYEKQCTDFQAFFWRDDLKNIKENAKENAKEIEARAAQASQELKYGSKKLRSRLSFKKLLDPEYETTILEI